MSTSGRLDGCSEAANAWNWLKSAKLGCCGICWGEVVVSTAPPPGAPSASARCPACGADVCRQHSGGGWRFYYLITMLLLFVMSFCFFSYLCGQRSGRHSRWVRYRRGLWLSWCRCGGEGAVHVERRGARVRGVGAGWRWRWGNHLKGLWRRTRLRPEHRQYTDVYDLKSEICLCIKKYFPTIQTFNTVRITRLTLTFVSWLAPGLRWRSLNCCNHHLHDRQKCWVSILQKHVVSNTKYRDNSERDFNLKLLA